MATGRGRSGGSVALDPAHVRGLARLAGIALHEAEVERLARELSSVLEQIETLREVELREDEEETRADEEPASLPETPPTADPLTRDPSALAPDWRDGFFVVPRPSAFEERGGGTDEPGGSGEGG